MAAYAALVSLVHVIDDLENHHSPPIRLDKQQVQSLTQNVMFLQEFLEGYISPIADGDEADPLEMRIADAAYAAEDVIESHIVNKTQPRLRRFLPRSKKSKNASSSSGANCHDETIELYQDLPNVIEEMDLIRREAMEIDTKKVVIHDQQNIVPIASSRPSSSSIGKKSSSMVCSDDVLLGIMEKLVADQPHRLVIPIVGMGGIGKTCLAKTIYSKPVIKERFDKCAWATISQQYDTREILREILSQATNKDKEKITERSEDKLGLELYQYLYGRRFLIVLDDMWSVDAWDNIQRFFPNDNQGSRVIVTTRLWQLSSQLNKEYSHQMEFLDEVNSWLLFSKTVFGENNCCPPELEEIGKKIVENCRGLPLSIVVVGGILKNNTKHTKGYWELIRKNLTSKVNLEDDKHCLRLLKLSYNHLPIHLKPCFLYMGVFEEDDEIEVSTLVKLWVCEGFLKPIDGKSLEIIAKGFLKDLVDRNLILTNELGSTGNIKSVKAHDLLRDLCLSEVKKEGFYHVVGQSCPRGISRQRRVVIRWKNSQEEVVDELKCMSHVRSVICEHGKEPRRSRNLALLRAFHVYDKIRFNVGIEVFNSFELQQHVNLQHLAIQVCGVKSIFASLNLLWNLHTLIVSCSNGSTVPAEIWKMPQFRHIELLGPGLGRRYSPLERIFFPDPPSDGLIMENLQVLKEVDNLKCCEEVVKRIPNIKKLDICYFGREEVEHDDDYCLSNIKCMCKLESLDIYCENSFRGNASLHKLIFPHSIKSLYLSMKDDFEWEGILDRIGSLPNLEKFKLYGGCFGRGKWEVVEDQFPSLKYLKLYPGDGLKEWRAETEGSSIFSRLEKLHHSWLIELKEIPSEIGDIPTLQRIVLINCSESVAMCMKKIVDEQVEQHGDQLPFYVHVYDTWKENEALKSLVGPNFKYEVY